MEREGSTDSAQERMRRTHRWLRGWLRERSFVSSSDTAPNGSEDQDPLWEQQEDDEAQAVRGRFDMGRNLRRAVLRLYNAYSCMWSSSILSMSMVEFFTLRTEGFAFCRETI